MSARLNMYLGKKIFVITLGIITSGNEWVEECFLLAHGVIIVDQTGAGIIAGLLPKDTCVVDKGAKD